MFRKIESKKSLIISELESKLTASNQNTLQAIIKHCKSILSKAKKPSKQTTTASEVQYILRGV